MQKINTHLWYDKEAVEAAELYTGLFRDSSIISKIQLHHDAPVGSVDIVEIDLAGRQFTLISAGPMFSFNPSISMLVSCDSKDEVDRLNETLSQGGQALMPLDSYPFSERYTWVQDRYGLSWQLYYNGGKSNEQYITPTLMFSGANLGKAEAAMEFYAKVFAEKGESGVGNMARYGSEPAGREGMVMHGGFTLLGQTFYAMDSGVDHDQPFNEEEKTRITQAFLQMKKFDLAALENAWRGES